MKKYILGIALLSVLASCGSKEENKTETASSGITFPYEARYTTEFNNNVSDSNLLTVLNFYKYWETGDMAALRNTMADSIGIHAYDGFRYNGPTDSLIQSWTAHRDSLASVVITMNVWLKSHSLKDSVDYINVWYKEVATYKSGRVDSANYEDDNAVKDGKIVYFSSHKQKLTK